MAAKDRQKRETMAQEILHIFFVVNVFHCLTPSLASVESPNQGRLNFWRGGYPISAVFDVLLLLFMIIYDTFSLFIFRHGHG